MSTISELVEDWGGFEEFGGVLFKNSPDVTVERNVKLYGRSATPRVIDILIRQRIPPTSEIRTIVECKYLNRNVERAEVDALRTVLNETQCHKAVILSRVGFQNGAIAAAKEMDIDTNVWRMRALAAAKGADDKAQLIYYSVGVNGVLLGQGVDDNIRLAYEWLVENYNDGDEIYIFGFSRGAYTARALAGLIAIDGVLKPGSPIGVAELFERYRKGDEETIWKLREMQASGDAGRLSEQERWLLKYAQPADVKMIGVSVRSDWLPAISPASVGRSSTISRPDSASISSTDTTRLPSTSIARISLPRCGPSITRRIRRRSSRNRARCPASSRGGSWVLMPTSEEDTRPTFSIRRRCAG